MSGKNSAGGLPGYRKAMSGGFPSEVFDTDAPAPPDAGLPWKVGDYSDNPLIDDPASLAPPKPDRGIKHLGKCQECGSTAFSATDAAPCPQCGEQITTPTYTPGTPWF